MVSLWRKLFCVGGGRAKPAHHPHKTLSMHGASTSESRRGADPSAAKVQPRFVRLSALSTSEVHRNPSGENSFAWVRAGRSPARTHAKLIPGTGREHRHPAEARPRPPPRDYRVSCVNQPGIYRWTQLVEAHSRAPTLIVNRYSLLVRPRPVRRQGTTKFVSQSDELHSTGTIPISDPRNGTCVTCKNV